MEVTDQLHVLAAFIPRERAPQWASGAGQDGVEKRKPLATAENPDFLAIQSTAFHCTKWAVGLVCGKLLYDVSCVYR